jgi:hypothetical protein
MPSRGRGRMVLPWWERDGEPRTDRLLRRIASATDRAPVAPPLSHRSRASGAGQARRSPRRTQSLHEANETDPFQPELRARRAAAPHDDPVPGPEASHDLGERLGRLEGETVEIGPVVAPDPERHVSARPREGGTGNGGAKSRREERAKVRSVPPGKVIAGRLVGVEEDPPVDRFRDDLSPRVQERACASGAQAEQHGAGSVRAHQEASRTRVVAEEERAVRSRSGAHAPRVNLPPSTRPPESPVGRELPGRAASGPGDRGGGPDEPPVAPAGPPPAPVLAQGCPGLRDRHDLANGPPVQGGGKRSVSGNERRIRARFTEPGTREYATPGLLAEQDRSIQREGAALPVVPDRVISYLPGPVSRSLPFSETGREGRVAAGLPRDVRIEPHEAGRPKEVHVELPSECEQLAHRPGRAPAAGAVGVVDADPDRLASRDSVGRKAPGRCATRARRGASGTPAGSARAGCRCAPARAGLRPA